MTAPTNTFVSTAAIGNREDLADTIYRISPTQTPLLSMASKTKATATLHEWQTQDLAAAASNAQAEGDDAAAKVVTPTVRLGNRTQISTKTVFVSGTQQATLSAGRKDEMGYQMALASLELKRDMELGLTQNNTAATSPRTSRGLVGWAGDNVDAGAGYVAPNYVTNVAQTDGTQAAFTETRMKNVLQKVYTAGGDPDTIMFGPLAKQTFSSFTGNSTRFDKGEDKSLTASVDVYVGDFGELKAVPNRFQRARDVWVLQSDKLAVAYLRPFTTIDLAPTGDSMKKEIVVEYCLENRAPKAHGGILDIL
ncbi:phage head protein [Rhodoferax koreense]|uniref:Phage head protein n=1 Tax=Rhodoferax koreensis TaxID=1842727 RepID=A0A1P8JV51_9BURK|nr:DUF5309 domain-containing protein [Rhodoferax koreense]APW37650.1 phage head protein [Rhodoferax koreense]